MKDKQVKAVALISGGLDSMLAAKIIQEQGVHVEGINFFTGFCHSGHTSAIRKTTKRKRNDALFVAEQLGMKLHIIDVVNEYKDVLLNPKFGYGKNMNPCLDCKIFMVSKAREWMEKNDFDFIITGEVIGQRPKSQLKSSMHIVSKNTDTDGRLVRPLCAKNLEPTQPELDGLIDREKLFAFHGRGRGPQIALAKTFKFDEYAQPAGGCCVLTDKAYSKKLVDLWQSNNTKDYDLQDLILLKVGRHFRLSENVKLIVSREEGEDNFLQGYKNKFISIRATSCLGALGLIDGDPNEEELLLASRIVGRFSQDKENPLLTMQIQHQDGTKKSFDIAPMYASDIKHEWYI